MLLRQGLRDICEENSGGLERPGERGVAARHRSHRGVNAERSPWERQSQARQGLGPERRHGKHRQAIGAGDVHLDGRFFALQLRRAQRPVIRLRVLDRLRQRQDLGLDQHRRAQGRDSHRAYRHPSPVGCQCQANPPLRRSRAPLEQQRTLKRTSKRRPPPIASPAVPFSGRAGARRPGSRHR